MVEIIFIAGLPTTGKTYLVNKIRLELKKYYIDNFKHGQVVGEKYLVKKKNIYILGIYEGNVFDGTDRLSMSVQPEAIQWIKDLDKNSIVIIEGDRLCNAKFFTALREIKTTILMLTSTEKTMIKRYYQRETIHSERFLKGRVTKLNNIIGNFEGLIQFFDEKKNRTELIRKVLWSRLFIN